MHVGLKMGKLTSFQPGQATLGVGKLPYQPQDLLNFGPFSLRCRHFSYSCSLIADNEVVEVIRLPLFDGMKAD